MAFQNEQNKINQTNDFSATNNLNHPSEKNTNQ